MNKDDRTQTRHIASRGIRETTLTGRRLAGLLTVCAAALALALGTALPARADSTDDLAKALLGALFVGVIVNELNDKPRAAPVVVPPVPVATRRVPAVCAISIDGSQRSVTLYPETCLRREGLKARLPVACANTATVFGQKDRVFSAQCLRDAGFRVPVY
jgi:hypothetical protein